MRDELQIGIKQSKRRRAENFLCRVDSILAQWVSFSRACFGRTNQGHIVMEGIDRGLRAFKSVARASAPGTIIVNGILPSNENLSRLFVKRHAPQRATGVFQDTGRLALSPSRDHKCQNPARCRDVKDRHSSALRFETGDGFLGFKDNALSRATIVDQIAANNGYRPVGETDCYLRQIVDDCKCRYLQPRISFPKPPAFVVSGVPHRKLPPRILHRHRRQTFRSAIFLLRIESPNFEHRLIRQVLRDGNKQRRTTDLLQMCNGPNIMRLERAQDTEG